MNGHEHLSSKKSLMEAAAQRIAEKQQAVVDEFDIAISEKIASSTVEKVSSVGDFLAEED